MNKDVKFSRFVGIGIIIICIWIVVLAFMSAILKNQNYNNLIYVDSGKENILNIPKSNVIINHIDMEKEIGTENGTVNFKARLPKVNIETKSANDVNNKIHAIYQETYGEILKSSNIQTIDINYTYEYLENDTVIEITIVTKTIVNNKSDETTNKFTYDLKNDKEIID